MKPKIITGKEIRNKAWLTIYEEQDEYIYAAEYDALLSDVAKLVEATREWHSVDDCRVEGRSDCRLCKAIVAIERHFPNKTSQP